MGVYDPGPFVFRIINHCCIKTMRIGDNFIQLNGGLQIRRQVRSGL